MSLSNDTLDTLAQRLDEAALTCTDTPSLADDVDLSVEDAYKVQQRLINRKIRRGEEPVGVKLGFTSRAKMIQMGVSDVIVGRLTDVMRYTDAANVNLSSFIHPKVEPEVAFRLGVSIDLDSPLTCIESYVEAVAPAMEIIDSRYRAFQFTYADVVADNTSAAAFVLGAWKPYQDLANRAVRLETPRYSATGSTAAILGDPTRALHALLTMCRRYRIRLLAGDVVLAGAATEALPFTEGVTQCDVAGLGRVTVRGVK
ncbi:4-oxalocrotonate decarboxylase [Streptomyces sp. DSM 41524]|uniref:4-oxalocrotonate decarboxylase n=1 Tax=Streptomyces asiaticus subsp. ignotus TaxID=3098222 RepID=A0ABU7Q7E1_9ACTN|nr:4-oxalocrotonate decarboxylase [Streptomyces sp. DSM 41524]